MDTETTTSTEKPDLNLFGDEVQNHLGQAKEACLTDEVCVDEQGVTCHTFELKTEGGDLFHTTVSYMRACHGEFIAAMENDVQGLIEMDSETYEHLGYEVYDDDGFDHDIQVDQGLAGPPRWFVECLTAGITHCQAGYDKFIEHLLDPSVSPYPQLVEHLRNNDPLFDHVPGKLFSFSPALAINSGFSPRYILNFCVALRSPRESNTKISPYVLAKKGRLTRLNMLVCAAVHDCFRASAGHSQFENWTSEKAKNFLEGAGNVNARKARDVFGKETEPVLFGYECSKSLMEKGVNAFNFSNEPSLHKIVEEYLMEKLDEYTKAQA